ncbi:TIGR00341 family protein [Luteimicrobium subarcticum]|uniref:Putative hydrophobic protein (TIGR00341 family) n=1 Tax=Luteimicrobium subarcticum TaxID=620910 RepID=A0A2M8W6V2_9MICO|nr:TIGR00341 family protein [Luteimicrobium subarcticum]PJI86624.1 putative hydrophobic protein (TIGR00341 family) [Luteimicrobium subarcticum]
MARNVLGAVLPASQRRTLDNLSDELDLGAGDVASKRSAFWTMLVLSAVIASAGIVSDSTATVIGAMIIAPLSTPIMGVAIGLARGSSATVWRSLGFVAGGMVVVVSIGVLVAWLLPNDANMLTNSQVTGRTSPGLFDLVSALATGFAGSVALARRDVAAVLPGVAIAISLVPPLAVVGVCLGSGAPVSAAGALVLFLSNLLSMVLAGTLVFTAAGYTVEALRRREHRRAYTAITLLLVLVTVPLVANAVLTGLVSNAAHHTEQVATQWVSAVPGAEVTDVSVVGRDVQIAVRTPDGTVPPTDDLLTALDGELVDGFHVSVVTTQGATVDVGTTD